MSHGLVFLFDSMACGHSILSNIAENQAIFLSVNGAAVINYSFWHKFPIMILYC